MSTFVWMKVLESAPERYDRGIQMLSGGRIGAVYERMAALAAAPGKRVLDIGCGTGGVSLACARRGAVVTGIDMDAGMLEVARRNSMMGAGPSAATPRVPRDPHRMALLSAAAGRGDETAGGSGREAPGAGSVTFLELGAAEIEDRFPPESFDAVVSCLAMSELSPHEMEYALRVARSRLTPGGMIVIGDESPPAGGPARAAYWLRRAPVAALTYLLTQATTRPLRGLEGMLRAAGFVAVGSERPGGGNLAIAHGRRVAI